MTEHDVGASDIPKLSEQNGNQIGFEANDDTISSFQTILHEPSEVKVAANEVTQVQDHLDNQKGCKPSA